MEKRAAMHAKGKRESWPCVLMPAPALSKKQEEKHAPSVCLFSHFLEEEHRGALLFLSFFGTDAGMLGYELTGVFLWLMACSL